MNYTSLEQSEELLKLGLSHTTADMHYIDKDEELIRVGWDSEYEPDGEHTPAWSVGALLTILRSYFCSLYMCDEHFVLCTPHNTYVGTQFINVCFNAMRALLEEGYITDEQNIQVNP